MLDAYCDADYFSLVVICKAGREQMIKDLHLYLYAFIL